MAYVQNIKIHLKGKRIRVRERHDEKGNIIEDITEGEFVGYGQCLTTERIVIYIADKDGAISKVELNNQNWEKKVQILKE